MLKNNMKKSIFRNNKGFTLIELIMVIVILGILAATAIPKYFSIKKDAANATAHGITAALMGAVTVLYARYMMGGTTGPAYDMQTVVENAQIAGITSSGILTALYTALIGGIQYSWTWGPADLPTTAGFVYEAF